VTVAPGILLFVEDFRPREREQKQRMSLLGELQSIVQNTYPGE